MFWLLFSMIVGSIVPAVNAAPESSPDCELSEILYMDDFPAIEADRTHLEMRTGAPYCFGEINVGVVQSRIDAVNALSGEALLAEVERVTAAYGEVLLGIAMDGNERSNMTYADHLQNAMCYPYPTRVGAEVTRVTFLTDPEGSFGGPAYPRLLLQRAVELHDTEATRALVTLMESVETLSGGMGGNCGYARSDAFQVTYQETLRTGDVKAADTFAKDFRFIRSSMAESTSYLLSSIPYSFDGHLTTMVRGVISRLIADGEYATANAVATHYGLEDDVRESAQSRLTVVYKEAFTAGNMIAVPQEITTLQGLFGFTSEEIVEARVVGYANAGHSLLYRPAGMATSFHEDSLDDRLEDLPHESRVLMAGWQLGMWDPPIGDLERIHAFMQKVEVSPDEVKADIAVAMASVARICYSNWEDGDPLRHWNYTLSIAYALDELGFDPNAAFSSDICVEPKPASYNDTIGIWFLVCGDGVEFAHRVARKVERQDIRAKTGI